MGLGKTYSALGVIKYFELRNHRVLVLCPKKLPENWTVYLAQNASELNPFIKDRFACTVLSHTDLSRESGKTVPFAALCALFDAETDHGQNIKAYSALLDQAVAAIVAQFARKKAANLFTGQGGKLMDAVKAVKGNSDFELITCLVIK